MAYSNFKYCPFCGSKIITNNMVKYCSYCGKSLVLSDNKTQGSHYNETIIAQDNLALEQVPADFNKYTDISFDMYNKANLGDINDSEDYSIILKYAPDRQRLVRRLEKVLLRGYPAIQLAIDNIPSLIIYKAKGNDIIYLNEVFIEEQASTSIVAGNFNHNPVVEDVFEMLSHRLSAQMQQTIKQIPVKLWVGDRIHGIFPNSYRENSKGIMIITDKGIYFLPDEICQLTPRWFVRSYTVLSQVVVKDRCLEFTYKDMKVASIDFTDKQKLFDAYQCIQSTVHIPK